MQSLLEDKVVLITGASSGIGRQTAIIAASQGAKVVAAARREADLAETVRLIEKIGGTGTYIPTDVTDGGQVEGAIQHAIATYGTLNAAFNNAGILEREVDFLDLENDVFDQVMNINVRGVYLSMKAEISYMLDNGAGAIVNDSSYNGKQGHARHPAYTASKHAVLGLTRSVAKNYARSGIRVNAVCPGPVDTDMARVLENDDEKNRTRLERWIPTGRYGQPEEIGNLVAYLMSDSSSFITGQAISIDGGATA
ncbi:MAG TPA: short chain dehydrogenase [Dehalococcoidia bacterium]|nr:short chain dehydrogenase [Chloroflexota bacterium]HCI86315.1 short chain dehydrogenase [Dehalococcoidia bacterium]|tara:strand:+ start:1413 stop:2171 length:759 start_codon:yes stop_codon:yes gene_type:complete